MWEHFSTDLFFKHAFFIYHFRDVDELLEYISFRLLSTLNIEDIMNLWNHFVWTKKYWSALFWKLLPLSKIV